MTPLKWRNLTVSLALAAVLLMPMAAGAVSTYEFDITTPNSGFLSSYTGPYAHVKITLGTGALAGDAIFDVTGLSWNGYQYRIGDGSALSLNFSAPVNILEFPTTNTKTANFYWDGGDTKTEFFTSNSNVSVFGDFTTNITDKDGFGSAVETLHFVVDPTGLDFTDAATVLTKNAAGYLARAHIFVANPDGTPVYAGEGNSPSGYATVPLPPTVLLLGSGLLGLGLVGIRKRK